MIFWLYLLQWGCYHLFIAKDIDFKFSFLIFPLVIHRTHISRSRPVICMLTWTFSIKISVKKVTRINIHELCTYIQETCRRKLIYKLCFAGVKWGMKTSCNNLAIRCSFEPLSSDECTQPALDVSRLSIDLWTIVKHLKDIENEMNGKSASIQWSSNNDT